MTTERRRFTLDEAAAASQIDISIVWYYTDLGLITPSETGYSDDDLAELRRVRRLREELELDHGAIEIILRMRRRIQALEAQLRYLEREVRTARGPRGQPDWLEAEWDDLF